MTAFMDPIAYILIALFGVLPPAVVGWWAYQQGKKGREDAYKMRDEAVHQVELLRVAIPKVDDIIKALPPYPVIPPFPVVPTVDDIIKALPPVKIPEDEMVKIRESLSQSIRGTIGNLIKEAGRGVKEGEQQVEAQMEPGDIIMKAIMGRVKNFLGD